MINLLTKEKQKAVYREYQFRVAVLSLMFLGFLGCVAAAVLIPSFVKLKFENEAVTSQIEETKKQRSPEQVSLEKEIEELTKSIAVLKEDSALEPKFIPLVNVVLAVKPSTMVLEGFSIQQVASEKGNQKFLAIEGTAATQDELQKFRSVLQTLPEFISVDLPADTVIKRTDIHFSMRLHLPIDASPAAAEPPSAEHQS